MKKKWSLWKSCPNRIKNCYGGDQGWKKKADDVVICLNHETQLLKKFSTINFIKCCNIFLVHERGASSKPFPQSRGIIGLEMAKNWESEGMKTLFLVKSFAVAVSPKQVKLDKESSTSEDSESSTSPVTKELQSAVLITEKEASTVNLGSFALLNESPLAPLHSIPKR